ncbi:AAA family ATPase [Ammoniphilus sp. CFH 90114]|uniref:AAA family ATPase n=1 Tax=Ammoniphilus sp. CFH 90114 TaxID=2493665 RepID=UPI00100F14AC|nr:AAA family ATPase [Ammoniphilus sp. CFH 90114]RXT05298.1 ATP-dependent Clp protease ATP-binding subunit [Ammoniphilus sp. CFH 90114]
MPFITDKLKGMEQKSIVLHSESQVDIEGKHLVTRFRFKAEDVVEKLRARIYGQDEIIDRLEETLKIIWSDISDPFRPLYVGLFLGPTGVGKTEMIRALAEAIHGQPEAFCRIDMNTLSQEHYAAALTGAPPGYVGSKEGSSLFDPSLIEGTYSKPGIVLFDEMEKANDQVLQSLLNVMDNGVMVIPTGEKKINFRNSMIFMTSNLGAEEIMEFAHDTLKGKWKRLMYPLHPKYWGKENLLQGIVQSKLEKRFTPEFINRFDDIFVFNWLEKEGLNPILDTFMASLNRRITKYQCMIKLDESAKEFLLKKGFDRKYGARNLRRTIRKYVEVPLAAHLSNRLQQDQAIQYIVSNSGDALAWKEEIL